jgi:uncharacterized protein (DUF4415 family)
MKTTDQIIVNETLTDDENPELTRADFAAMIPASQFFAERGIPIPRKRGQRGNQKTPTKKPVYIRLSPEVINAFRATGKGWQSRIDNVLKQWLTQQPPLK